MDIRLIEAGLRRFKASDARKLMLDGERYYRGEHDILFRKRTAIGSGGELEEVLNLPNNRLIDNQYAKIVDQKVNYLLGKPLTFDTENESYIDALSSVFDMGFYNMFRCLGEDVLNSGIGYVHPYYTADGEFRLRRFEPYEILPFWADEEHTTLSLVARLYEVEVYDGMHYKTVEKVELYYNDRVERYVWGGSGLAPDSYEAYNYLTLRDGGKSKHYKWDRVPIIAFKYNNMEIPLLPKVKSLQDALNLMISDLINLMSEDTRNTILILKNYDGTNLAEFRHNLTTLGVVKVRTIEGADGGVDSLRIEVDANNYDIVLKSLKKALIENAMGYDAKDDKLSGNPNQMNIKSMYSDIDLDANKMEGEFQASFENLLWFVNAHLKNTGVGDFTGEEVKVIFNRDILMNETEVIENCQKSVGILSNESIIAQHPWVTDAAEELKRVEAQREEELEQFGFDGDIEDEGINENS